MGVMNQGQLVFELFIILSFKVAGSKRKTNV